MSSLSQNFLDKAAAILYSNGFLLLPIMALFPDLVLSPSGDNIATGLDARIHLTID